MVCAAAVVLYCCIRFDVVCYCSPIDGVCYKGMGAGLLQKSPQRSVLCVVLCVVALCAVLIYC